LLVPATLAAPPGATLLAPEEPGAAPAAPAVGALAPAPAVSGSFKGLGASVPQA
jgi:hypothetical protein